jgi:ribosomal protein S18 acetylase RimI-like enzyme
MKWGKISVGKFFMEFKQTDISRLPEIAEMNREVFDGMYDRPVYTLDDYKKRLEGVTPIIFIAEDNGKVVGNCISYESDGKLYLWVSGVLKEYRNQGIASKLFDMREQYAREHNYKKIFTKVYNVSKEMLCLLIKRGYEIMEVFKKDNPKYNAIILELDIK